MLYPVLTPWWLQKIYSSCVWKLPADNNKVYLTFDDGPHPEITSFVLDYLRRYEMKATFFCIGNNIRLYPDVFEKIKAEGHAIGNHTYNHLNGWKTKDGVYFENIIKAHELMNTDLFRPPYGRATHFQMNELISSPLKMKIIMWTVLSGDFDPALSNEACLKNVTSNLKAGNIIVFHDSKKAEEKLKYALPLVLEQMKKTGLTSEKISFKNA